MLKRDLYYERISTKSLRDDVRYLGNILGRVIKDQEGNKFFDLVEKTRLLSKANIANKNKKPENLTACILDRPRHNKIINELNFDSGYFIVKFLASKKPFIFFFN